MKIKNLLVVSIFSLFLMSGCAKSEMHSTLSNAETSLEKFSASKSSQPKEKLNSYYRDKIDQSIDDAIENANSHQSVISESFEYRALSNKSEFVKEVVKYYRKQLAEEDYAISDIDIEYLQDHRLIIVSMVIECYNAK